MARADDARVSFGRELGAGKRIEFDERLSGYGVVERTLSLDDSIALTVGRPHPPPKKPAILDASWTSRSWRSQFCE